MNRILILFLFLILTVLDHISAQEFKSQLTGTIVDKVHSEPIEFAVINLKGTGTAVQTDSKGYFILEVPSDVELELDVFRMDYKSFSFKIDKIAPGATKNVVLKLAQDENVLNEIVVSDYAIQDKTMIREGVTEMKFLPSASGNIESLLPHIALGTSSGTGGELSSQYNVRGGNYDENLLYINDFEIYRPQLIRSGQQEGLSFPNIDLIKDLQFSSGGFGAKFGDKMSSVLDVKYKLPSSFAASVGLSLLGTSAHLEGSFKVSKDNYRRVRFLFGARHKTTRYLLNTTSIKGEYQPDFFDFQTYITYDISKTIQLGLIGNYNLAKYKLIPESGISAKGLIDFTLRLRTDYEGQEVDEFYTQMGGISLTYLPDNKKNPTFLKWLASVYSSQENERFDLIGTYGLYEVETSLGSDDAGEDKSLLGQGIQQRFARNYLRSTVANTELKGGTEFNYSGRSLTYQFLQYGIKFQTEKINDKINEWERLDSAGFSLPTDTNYFRIRNVLKTTNNLNSNRFTAYIQDGFTFQFQNNDELQVIAGIRGNYWTLNNDFFITPRMQLIYTPKSISKTMTFKLSGGLYYQPPFYRELRNFSGQLDTNLMAQKSAQIVGGWTYDFGHSSKGKKKYKLIVEGYYKKLWDLVPYDVDNVRVRYYGANEATGYAMGLDVRLNGEFVPDAESWFNFSLLRTREAIDGVTHLKREPYKTEAKEVSDVPRPTDQLATLAIFFQDYLPQNKNFKMHMGFTLGTGLPFGIPDNNRVFRNTYRFNPYHRVDIGFSVTLYDRKWKENKPNHFLRFTKYTWLSLEVFNLLKIQNAASNNWIKDIFNVSYALPNYLTSRRINLKLKMDF